MKWGLFGGTFDPIHIGHLRCAEEILEMLSLDQIVFIPTPRPPHKTERHITSFKHREKMLSLAIKGNPSFQVSSIEDQRIGKSFSIDTIKYFLDTYKEISKLFFIIGQDQFNDIKTWKDWKELLLLCHFAVMTRAGYEEKGLSNILSADLSNQFFYDKSIDGFKGPTGHFIFFRKVTFLEISSTNIRNRIENRNSIRYLTPDRVCNYISENSLYM